MTIRTLAEVEKEEILRAILVKGSIVQAAAALGIGRNTIYAKLHRYGLKVRANEIIRELKRQQVFPKSVQS
jgi:DNA-binding NtrC family response regulator